MTIIKYNKMDTTTLELSLCDINDFCKSLNGCSYIENIYGHIMEDDIIQVKTNLLKCSILTDDSRCNKQSTHVVISKNGNPPVNLCWYHCLELHNKIINHIK